ncbi:hypothetical protein RB195_015485 [Necator americanus]|uniref:Uncharacterized protein n=1 Tax=Necator americanus TaxID=51031 RepID=A0ABR1E4U7_NECAM
MESRPLIFPFTINTVTSILLHAISVSIVLKSITKCCKQKTRSASGVDRTSAISRSRPSQSLKSSAKVKSEAPTPRNRSENSADPPKDNTPKPTLKEDQTQYQTQEKSVKFLPYPEVREPSPSAKKRRHEELEKEKKNKIAQGFYQERSDEDDTLEKVNSLKMEQSDATLKKRSLRKKIQGDSKIMTARLPPKHKMKGKKDFLVDQTGVTYIRDADKANALALHFAMVFSSVCSNNTPEIVGIAPIQQQRSVIFFHPSDVYKYLKSFKPSIYFIYDDENYLEVRTALQTSLAKMSDWPSRWDLRINYGKSLVMHVVLFCVHAARQTCSYSHPRGYSLRWLILGDNVIFRLNFTNFPPSSFTGVSFETENNGDSETIIVEVNQGGVDVFDVDQHHLGVPLRVRDTVTILRSNYSGQKLFVEFSRPIVSELTDLNNCLMWNVRL